MNLRKSLALLPLMVCYAQACGPADKATVDVLDALKSGTAPRSVIIEDRNGRLIREVRANGVFANQVRLSRLSPHVVPALIAAEDARFFYHPGIDPLAVLRALGQLIREGSVVSGASTITQQLARSLAPRPRTVTGKLQEMALALRIERSLSKERILEEYLNRIAFGPTLVGIEAASRHYFDKPARELSLAEAATLVSIPRSPSVYDVRKAPERVLRRRNRVLGRMKSGGLADHAAIERAMGEPLQHIRPYFEGGLTHLSLALANGSLNTGLPPGQPYATIRTTIDAALQREVETLAREAARRVADYHATALSVVVVDNASGEILAYVGSPDYFEKQGLGANDGVCARRQPGSALKPFVYAAAMQSLGYTAATLLPDIELALPTAQGLYAPRNYDRSFHGPVRLRKALANSLNVPAVATAQQLGPGRVLSLLRKAGFSSLTRSAEHYGVAIALGDGEVRLIELAEAYSMLARGGERLPLSFVQAGTTTGGRRVTLATKAAERVLDSRDAAVLTDILSDDVARASSFGRGGVLEMPFPAAVKTGTSKGFRDNWAIGYTKEITVAVWAGNFDATPMTGSTGVTGAGPLFRDVLMAAMRNRTPLPLTDRHGLVETSICALSGQLPGPHCPHRARELFRAEHVPTATCTMHVLAPVEVATGALARPNCPGTILSLFEEYPARYRAWAHAAGRPLAPQFSSTRCPPALPLASTYQSTPVMRFPYAGSQFRIDPAGPAVQEIVLAASAAPSMRAVRFVLDGVRLASVRAPFELAWQLRPGRHTVWVETEEGASSEPVQFDVGI